MVYINHLMRKAGRPQLPQKDRRVVVVATRVTVAELKHVERAAERERRTVADWVRLQITKDKEEG